MTINRAVFYMILGALSWWLLIAGFNVAVASASTTSIGSTNDDPAWLKANGLTPVATLETDAQTAKNFPDRCWHARVFAGLRGYDHKFATWAWEKSIVCPLGGAFSEQHVRWGKGTNEGWSDGPYPSISTHNMSRDHRMAYSHYQTDFLRGYANWGVLLNLRQYFSHRVDRQVAWHHYGSS